MKKEELFEYINDIDEKYIKIADEYKIKNKLTVWIKWTVVAACLCMIVGSGILFPRDRVDSDVGNTNQKDNFEEGVEEKEDITEEMMQEDTEIDVYEDQPVQNEDIIIKSYDDIWGGSYIDESGKWVVWLTENTTENQQIVLERNINLKKANVIFKEADFSLNYLNELLARISDEMGSGEIPYVSSAMVSEQTNRVEVYLSTSDEESISKVVSLDIYGGAITIMYSEEEGGEDLEVLE